MTLLTRNKVSTLIIKMWTLNHFNTLSRNFSSFRNEIQRFSLHYDIRKHIPGLLLSHCQYSKSQLKPICLPTPKQSSKYSKTLYIPRRNIDTHSFKHLLYTVAERWKCGRNLWKLLSSPFVVKVKTIFIDKFRLYFISNTDNELNWQF